MNPNLSKNKYKEQINRAQRGLGRHLEDFLAKNKTPSTKKKERPRLATPLLGNLSTIDSYSSSSQLPPTVARPAQPLFCLPARQTEVLGCTSICCTPRILKHPPINPTDNGTFKKRTEMNGSYKSRSLVCDAISLSSSTGMDKVDGDDTTTKDAPAPSFSANNADMEIDTGIEIYLDVNRIADDDVSETAAVAPSSSNEMDRADKIADNDTKETAEVPPLASSSLSVSSSPKATAVLASATIEGYIAPTNIWEKYDNMQPTILDKIEETVPLHSNHPFTATDVNINEDDIMDGINGNCTIETSAFTLSLSSASSSASSMMASSSTSTSASMSMSTLTSKSLSSPTSSWTSLSTLEAATAAALIGRNKTSANKSPPIKRGRRRRSSINPPRKSTKKSGGSNSKFIKQVQSVKEILGTGTFDILKTLDKPQACRPYLAQLFSHSKSIRSREAASEAIGTKIERNEWNEIKIHAKYHGVGVDVEPVEKFQCKIDGKVLQKFLFFMDSLNAKKAAYGNEVLEILNRHDTVTIDSVSLVEKLEKSTCKFINELYKEFDLLLIDQESLPSNECRCCKKDRSKRRCMKPKNHEGNCHFTPKGSISFTTARDFLSSLSGSEMKKLAGLDDVKTLKGRDNFLRMETIVDQVFDEEKAKSYKERISEISTFYLTDFIPHLSVESNCKCCCLTCGFCDPF